MKVPCGEGLASHASPESCGDDRKVVLEALTGEDAGRVLSSEILNSPGRRPAPVTGKATPKPPRTDPLPGGNGSRGVTDPEHALKHLMRKPGGPASGPSCSGGPAP